MAASQPQPVFHNAEEGTKLVQATTKFALKLYTDLASSGSVENIFVSPISISMALAMTFLGAKGNTMAEMKKALDLDEIKESELHQTFSDLRESLRGVDGKYKLHIANRLFGQNTYKFLAEYLEATKKLYGAELAAVDFVQNAGAAVEQINDWVAENTNQKIRNIVTNDSVDGTTKLVLVNAIYFKGDWNKKFSTRNTRDDDFHISQTEKKKVPLMYMRESEFVYGQNESLHCQAVELPYVGETLSMFILLPDQTAASLETLEKALTWKVLMNIDQEFQMRKEEIDIWIPKFTLEEKLNLNDALAKMGAVDMFRGGSADFSGMDGSRDLYVSQVVHKAFVEVNEEGTEAAAATGVTIMQMCAKLNKIRFKADHPFLFFIRDNATKAILFLGRLAKP